MPVYTDAKAADERKNIEESAGKEMSVEERVKEYFKDTPILAEIARCESTFRQFDKDGKILRGDWNSRDVGVMQINERFHLDKALRLGYDIYSLEGNIEYAKYLYETQGLKPWTHSEKCWNSQKIAKS